MFAALSSEQKGSRLVGVFDFSPRFDLKEMVLSFGDFSVLSLSKTGSAAHLCSPKISLLLPSGRSM